MSTKTLKAIAVVAELTGTEMSMAVLQAMEADLDQFPEQVVLDALLRCRRELTGRLTLQAVLVRIDEADGRPGSDEAWSLAIAAHDEAETVVWTTEIAEAFGVAAPILAARDKTGARMAFREAYERITRASRQAGSAVRWLPSLGSNSERRRIAITAGIAQGKLTQIHAAAFLPAQDCVSPVLGLLSGDPVAALLTGPKEDVETARRGMEMVRRHLADLKRHAEDFQKECDAFEDQMHAAQAADTAKRKRQAMELVEAEIAKRGQA